MAGAYYVDAQAMPQQDQPGENAGVNVGTTTYMVASSSGVGIAQVETPFINEPNDSNDKGTDPK